MTCTLKFTRQKFFEHQLRHKILVRGRLSMDYVGIFASVMCVTLNPVLHIGYPLVSVTYVLTLLSFF